MSAEVRRWKTYAYVLIAPALLSAVLGAIASFALVAVYRPEWLGPPGDPKDLHGICVALPFGFALDAIVLAIPTLRAEGGGPVRDQYGIVQTTLPRVRFHWVFRAFTGAWCAACLLAAAVLGFGVLHGDL